jgi:hypothetical protein
MKKPSFQDRMKTVPGKRDGPRRQNRQTAAARAQKIFRTLSRIIKSPVRTATFYSKNRRGCISRNCGKDGCNQPDLGAVRNPMGRKKPEGLIHTIAQGERSVALGKDAHCANPERVQHRGTQEGKGRNLLCPFRARRIINRLPRAALRLPWDSVSGILSGFFCGRTSGVCFGCPGVDGTRLFKFQ